jgi:hypothetical protein
MTLALLRLVTWWCRVGPGEAAYEYDNTGSAANATRSATIQRLEQPWTLTYDLVDRPHGTWHAHTGSATDPASRA